jgi:GGDEF domain-containing protein
MVERLRGAVASCSLPTEQGQLRFTVSLGAAAAMDGDDTSALMRHAAEALDAAVKSDGNCGYFHNGQWSEMIRLTLQETR